MTARKEAMARKRKPPQSAEDFARYIAEEAIYWLDERLTHERKDLDEDAVDQGSEACFEQIQADARAFLAQVEAKYFAAADAAMAERKPGPESDAP